MDNTQEKRIDTLEVKIAFLEETLSTLSDEFYKQQLTISTLKLQNEKLSNKLSEIQSSEADDASYIIDDKPPHY